MNPAIMIHSRMALITTCTLINGGHPESVSATLGPLCATRWKITSSGSCMCSCSAYGKSALDWVPFSFGQPPRVLGFLGVMG